MGKSPDQTARQRLLESLDRGPGTVWRRELDTGIVAEGTTRGAYAHGPYREWFPNGQLRLERHYRASELDGVCRQYAADGRLLVEFTMTAGDGVFIEHWDNGARKTRWLQFRVDDSPCALRELCDIHGEQPLLSYTWKGGPCRTKKRFLQELEKYGLTLPPEETRFDAAVWAEFARLARQAKRRTSPQ